MVNGLERRRDNLRRRTNREKYSSFEMTVDNESVTALDTKEKQDFYCNNEMNVPSSTAADAENRYYFF